jgi:hypothetical protein
MLTAVATACARVACVRTTTASSAHVRTATVNAAAVFAIGSTATVVAWS